MGTSTSLLDSVTGPENCRILPLSLSASLSHFLRKTLLYLSPYVLYIPSGSLATPNESKVIELAVISNNNLRVCKGRFPQQQQPPHPCPSHDSRSPALGDLRRILLHGPLLQGVRNPRCQQLCVSAGKATPSSSLRTPLTGSRGNYKAVMLLLWKHHQRTAASMRRWIPTSTAMYLRSQIPYSAARAVRDGVVSLN